MLHSVAFQGVASRPGTLPRALPWAGGLRPFRPREKRDSGYTRYPTDAYHSGYTRRERAICRRRFSRPMYGLAFGSACCSFS